MPSSLLRQAPVYLSCPSCSSAADRTRFPSACSDSSELSPTDQDWALQWLPETRGSAAWLTHREQRQQKLALPGNCSLSRVVQNWILLKGAGTAWPKSILRHGALPSAELCACVRASTNRTSCVCLHSFQLKLHHLCSKMNRKNSVQDVWIWEKCREHKKNN